MCAGNEPDEGWGLCPRYPHLEPHQLDAHGDSHVAYLRPMPGETVDGALEDRFTRFDPSGYCEAIAGLGLARVARYEYRHLIVAGMLDVQVSASELALEDVFGADEDGIGVVTIDEIARQFVRLGWAPEPEEAPGRS